MRVTIPGKWDIETDVVVVGYGGAGAVAAITASDRGASVVILEKAPTGGGTTKVAGGGWLRPTDMRFCQYVEKLCAGTTEPELIRLFVEKSMKTGDWLKSIGGDPYDFKPVQISYVAGPLPGASYPWLPGAEFMVKMKLRKPAGTEDEVLWPLLSSNVEKRPIKVMTNTPAEDLITGPKGEVIGVRAQRGAGKVFIKAKKAVILTCGGFEYDEAMKNDYLPCRPFYAFADPNCTGDGVRMAQKVGAALWHMPATSAALGFKTPEYVAAFNVSFVTERFIFVNRDGKRFLDEAGLEDHEIATRVCVFDTARWTYPQIPVYAVFDEAGRKKAPLFQANSGFNRTLYKWSPDNSVEINKGWITKGKTIAELARKIKVNGPALERCLSQYNEFCKMGRDADFGRAAEALVPLDTPPYYAIELYPSLCNTQGGPRRDGESRVVNPDGKPIPRLYSAGELGSVWGFLYQGSGNLAECIVFGEIAGRNAAAEEPLE
ncbi:MAG: FAD-dependent oxidoreductase [Chloroflexi bacterium]|nr:FAD-dependent oxidoreductase [Chloroflexota bacterium]